MHTVVETSVYLREASKLLSDAERERGCFDDCEGPGNRGCDCRDWGVRKIRIALQGGGKSGGSRVIYYFCDETMPVFLMQIYAKNEKANLSASEKNQLKKLSEEFKRRHRR
jgi:RelE toxin of RelE / RelB toxin-antitoxin system